MMRSLCSLTIFQLACLLEVRERASSYTFFAEAMYSDRVDLGTQLHQAKLDQASDSSRSLQSGNGCSLVNTEPIIYDPTGTVVAGTTEGASSSLRTFTDGNCGAMYNSPTVWYTFQTGPNQDRIVAMTCVPELTEFDTVLTLFREEDGECTCVGRDDNDDIELNPTNCLDGHSALRFVASPLSTYHIAVSGSNATQFGRFHLAIFKVGQLHETRMAIEMEPVFGSFGGPTGYGIVETASILFFGLNLINDFFNLQEVPIVNLVDFELREPDDSYNNLTQTKETRKLWIDLHVSALLSEFNEDFGAVLRGYIDDYPEDYTDKLKLQESEYLGEENLEYFSSVERVMVGGPLILNTTKSSSPTPASTTQTLPTTITDDSSSKVVVLTIFGAILIVSGIMVCMSHKIAEKGKMHRASSATAAPPPIVPVSPVQQPTPSNLNTSSCRTTDSSATFLTREIVTASAMKVSIESKIGIKFEEEQRDSDEEDISPSVIIIGKVSKKSIFAGQGLRRGMLLMSVNRQPVAGKNLKQIKSMIRKVDGEILTIKAQSSASRDP